MDQAAGPATPQRRACRTLTVEEIDLTSVHHPEECRAEISSVTMSEFHRGRLGDSRSDTAVEGPD